MHARTRQPFSFGLLERAHFDYDTEPACRAVVVARAELAARGQVERTWEFFAGLQRLFYVESTGLSDVAALAPLCASLGLDLDAFRAGVERAEARERTLEEFSLVRRWGVQGFPTVLFKQGTRLVPLARGFATAEQLVRSLDRAAA